MTEFRFFRKLTSTTCQQQACQVKNSEKVTSRVFDKGRSKEQMTVPTMNDLWWLFSYFCFVYSCCHFEQPQPWAGFVHEFSPRCLLVVVQLGCAMSDILHHIHFSCAEWGRHLDVGGIDAWCNRFASEGDPSKWCCSAGVQTPSEDRLDCFTSISLISSSRSLWACSMLCSIADLVICKAHNRKTAWVKIYHVFNGCLLLLYALPSNTSVLVL